MRSLMLQSCSEIEELFFTILKLKFQKFNKIYVCPHQLATKLIFPNKWTITEIQYHVIFKRHNMISIQYLIIEAQFWRNATLPIWQSTLQALLTHHHHAHAPKLVLITWKKIWLLDHNPYDCMRLWTLVVQNIISQIFGNLFYSR